MDSVAAVDWTAYETEALAAYGAASSADELADVNIRYLGRKAPLPQALRGVRDPESGQTLNTLRATLEAAGEAAAARIARAGGPDLSGVDVTIPGVRIERGRLHLLTQSVARSRTSSSAWATRSGTATRLPPSGRTSMR